MATVGGNYNTNYEGNISGAPNTRIKCYLYLGDYTNSIPVRIKIPISTATPATTPLTIYIANIKNPIAVNKIIH